MGHSAGGSVIRNRGDLERYWAADLRAVGLEVWRWRWRFTRPIPHWTRSLRRMEYLHNRYAETWLRPYVALRRVLFQYHSIRMGFSVPLNIFGPGLSIAHWGTITISARASVGANCRIHPGVCLGTKDGAAPQIGDNCYLGPGAKLFGGITLGNRVQVGANAVVNRSFGDDSVLVGIPARNIGSRAVRKRTGEYPPAIVDDPGTDLA